MKLKIVICCFVLLEFSNLVHGSNILEFAQKVAERNRETLKKVRENFKGFQIFQPTTVKNQNPTSEADTSTSNGQNTTINITENTVVSTTTSSTVEIREPSKQNLNTIVFPSEESANETTTSKAVETTTEQKGRENFAGNCETGYKRTTDGRCMPTY